MPGPIHLPRDEFAEWVACCESFAAVMAPIRQRWLEEVAERIDREAIAPTGWTSREHDGQTPAPRDDGPKWVGKGRKR